MIRTLNVKIIASLGPSSAEPATIEALARAGASGFRINFSHGSKEFWDKLVEGVRAAEKAVGRPITLIGDLRGASVRIGDLDKEIVVKKGDAIKFSLRPEEGSIPLPVREVFENIEVGDLIVMDDGRSMLRVIDVGGDWFLAVAVTDAVIRSRKGLVVRGKDLGLPTLSDYDIECLRYACSKGFDYIGLSYVRRRDDVEVLKSVMREIGCSAGLIAKIETVQAVERIDEIVRAADAVLVARGDLGMNLGLERVPEAQTRIVDAALRAGTPVIVATQLLESMLSLPVPTRAEVVDVTVAVREGVDALMLTGETAIGKYPVEAVKWLSRIARAAEKGEIRRYRDVGDLRRRFAKGIVELAEDLGSKLLIYSFSGRLAVNASILRPRAPLYVAVGNWGLARRLAILWGIRPVVVEAGTYEEGLERAYEALIASDELRLGDLVTMAYGISGDEQIIKLRRVARAPNTS